MRGRKVFAGGEFLVADCAPADVFVPEEFSSAQRMIHEAAAEFVKKEVLPNLDQIEAQAAGLLPSLLAAAGRLGLNAIDIPEEYGGEAMDKVSTCLVTEAMGGCASFAVTHAAHTGIGTLPIVFFGTESQKKKYLPRLATGESIAAYCLTEPNAGSDALGIQTTATLAPDGRHYRLSGEKIYITNGALAELFIVYAKVDGEKFTAFVVERGFRGISHGAEEKKLGLKGSSTTSVVLQDCRVPVENVLYEVGRGHKIAFNILNIGRFKLGASVLGGCKVAIAQAAAHATLREQFGRKICTFGMIQKKLADMAVRTYMIESMVYRLAAALDDKFREVGAVVSDPREQNARALEEYAMECSIVKVLGSEGLDFCVDELVQIHGGGGYTMEYAAERMYRDSRINRIFEGTNEINRLLIAGTLFKRGLQNRLPLAAAIRGGVRPLEGDPRPGPAQPPDAVLFQARQLRMCKQVALGVAGAAAQKLGDDLGEAQGVLEPLANMLLEIYTLESGLLRAWKCIAARGEEKARHHLVAVQLYGSGAVPRIAHWARQVLAHVAPADRLAASLAPVNTLAAGVPVDSIALRRQLAEKVIRGRKYPF